MKIVTHTEMLELPIGTVFSFFGERDGGSQGELLGSLYVKGKTLRHGEDGKPFDFEILNMLPQMRCSGDIDPFYRTWPSVNAKGHSPRHGNSWCGLRMLAGVWLRRC